MFDKKGDFNTISKFDKTGKRIEHKDKMMQKFYKMDKEDEVEESEADKSGSEGNEGAKNKFYDEDG